MRPTGSTDGQAAPDQPRFMACLEPMLPRRKVLAASGTALPLFLTLSACAGPSPLTVLKGPPPLSSDVRALLDAASSEENLVYLYKKAIASYPALGPVLSP